MDSLKPQLERDITGCATMLISHSGLGSGEEGKSAHRCLFCRTPAEPVKEKDRAGFNIIGTGGRPGREWRTLPAPRTWIRGRKGGRSYLSVPLWVWFWGGGGVFQLRETTKRRGKKDHLYFAIIEGMKKNLRPFSPVKTNY